MMSVNDVYTMVQRGLLDPPPKPSSDKSDRGAPMRNVFKNVDYFINTHRKEPSVIPEAKGRKVTVFLYCPEFDNEVTEAVENWAESDILEWV